MTAEPKKWDARGVLHRLYAKHPGSGGQMPGPWTCIEEWRNIDLLAFSAWASAARYARVGYEVKVSRADMRSELLNPYKRKRNVEWCNEFYFAVPAGLMTPYEQTWEEPEWSPEDWTGQHCAGFNGQQCETIWKGGGRRKTHYVEVPVPTTDVVHRFSQMGWERIVCPTCKGKGITAKSRVEEEAPQLWVPRDVGLVVVDGRGAKVVKPSPKRKDVPALSAAELGQFVRWISMRPDPRHQARRDRRRIEVPELVA